MNLRCVKFWNGASCGKAPARLSRRLFLLVFSEKKKAAGQKSVSFLLKGISKNYLTKFEWLAFSFVFALFCLKTRQIRQVFSSF